MLTGRGLFSVVASNTYQMLVATLVTLVVLAVSGAPAMARDTFLEEIQGGYSLQLMVHEAVVKYGGADGSVVISTETTAYDDAFVMTSGGDFSGCQIAGGSDLYREDQFSGGGAIDTATQSSDLNATFSIQGDDVYLTQDFGFGDQGDAAWVSLRLSLNADSAWIQFAYDGEASRIQTLMNTYGLSEGEAMRLARGDVYGLIAQLSRFGCSEAELVDLARMKGLDYLREILATLTSSYSPGPIDEAAAKKYGISFSTAKELFKRYGDSTFVAALRRSVNYLDFLANLEGWNMKVLNGSIINKTKVALGEEIVAAFELLHPATGKQLFTPWLKPFASVAQVLSNGKLNCLPGYYSYIEFRLDPKTGAYYALIKSIVDENTQLEPGDYYAFIVFRNPGNDTYPRIRVKFTVT